MSTKWHPPACQDDAVPWPWDSHDGQSELTRLLLTQEV